MWKTVVGLLNGIVEAYNGWFKKQERVAAEDTGAVKQREKTLEDENSTLAGDRVRGANAELQSRTMRDHGIEIAPDSERVLPTSGTAPS